jgi:hypothetical protein
MALGALTPGNQYYNASGEATPEAKLPTEYQAQNVSSSPFVSVNRVPPEWMPDIKRAPVVDRRPRMNGIWHLYSRLLQRQPYERVGQPGGAPPRPYISAFQPNDMGPIRNGGFNNALYQAGYPGFNLGLSFKVQTLPTGGGPRTNMDQGGPQTVSQTRKVRSIKRSTGNPPRVR